MMMTTESMGSVDTPTLGGLGGFASSAILASRYRTIASSQRKLGAGRRGLRSYGPVGDLHVVREVLELGQNNSGVVDGAANFPISWEFVSNPPGMIHSGLVDNVSWT